MAILVPKQLVFLNTADAIQPLGVLVILPLESEPPSDPAIILSTSSRPDNVLHPKDTRQAG